MFEAFCTMKKSWKILNKIDKEELPVISLTCTA